MSRMKVYDVGDGKVVVVLGDGKETTVLRSYMHRRGSAGEFEQVREGDLSEDEKRALGECERRFRDGMAAEPELSECARVILRVFTATEPDGFNLRAGEYLPRNAVASKIEGRFRSAEIAGAFEQLVKSGLLERKGAAGIDYFLTKAGYAEVGDSAP